MRRLVPLLAVVSLTLHDLCERVLRAGMRRSELVSTLGEGDPVGHLLFEGAAGPWPWTPSDIGYWMGKTFGGHDRWLVLFMDDDVLGEWEVIVTHS